MVRPILNALIVVLFVFCIMLGMELERYSKEIERMQLELDQIMDSELTCKREVEWMRINEADRIRLRDHDSSKTMIDFEQSSPPSTLEWRLWSASHAEQFRKLSLEVIPFFNSKCIRATFNVDGCGVVRDCRGETIVSPLWGNKRLIYLAKNFDLSIRVDGKSWILYHQSRCSVSEDNDLECTYRAPGQSTFQQKRFEYHFESHNPSVKAGDI